MRHHAVRAVRAVRQDWQPGRANSVGLLTDGRDDDDDHGVGLGDLLTRLVEETDPKRPVQVITIHFGRGDPQALRAISAVTGGVMYQPHDPQEIRGMFLDAIGRRPCAPGC